MIQQNANNPKFKVIDVRTPEEYSNGHIKGSHLVPLGDLTSRLSEFKKDELYLMVCRSGARSANATQILNSKGYKATNLEGGMIAWTALNH